MKGQSQLRRPAFPHLQYASIALPIVSEQTSRSHEVDEL
jgi:hypothetical protein